MRTHLEVNQVDLATTPIVQGASLSFDPVRERFVDSDDANTLLTRAYRPPYVVPPLR